MKPIHYNVFIIGSGVAGQTVAKACAVKKLKVAITDNREYGGTCANRGCDPKKVLLEFSSLLEKSQRLNHVGVDKLPKINWKQVQKFKNKFIDKIPVKTEENLKSLDIDLYHQSPQFISETEVLVEGKTVSADYFIIATGRVPKELNIKGEKYIETSDAILDLNKIPKSVSFIGSGYVGMEFATMLAVLGCKVTMFQHNKTVLSNFDQFLVKKLMAKMNSFGVEFIFNAKVVSAQKRNKNIRIKYEVNGTKKRHKSRKVFNTAGRVPSVEMLDLEQANVDFDETGILVNEFLQSKTNRKIYACGDVSNASLPLTPLSGLQGNIVSNNILKEHSKKYQYPLVPSTVFTLPNLSSVGLSETQAKKRYKNILIFKGDLHDKFNARKENESTYAYKILANKRTKVIVGAHILGPKANENINILLLAIHSKMTVSAFKKLIFTYPSYSNDLKYMMADDS